MEVHRQLEIGTCKTRLAPTSKYEFVSFHLIIFRTVKRVSRHKSGISVPVVNDILSSIMYAI